MSVIGTLRSDLSPQSVSKRTYFMSTRPSVMGRVRLSPPNDRHVAELTLLSVVSAEAATLCCQTER
jgi:hypothetical protein